MTRIFARFYRVSAVFLVVLFALFAVATTGTRPAHAADKTLRIGMTQYPATMHPGIDSMLAKTYVLGMVTRPFTAYDADWRLTCMLCEKLPSYEDGTAEIETREDGTKGIAATYTIREGAKWGDGTPVTSDDVVFAWEVGKHPETGFSNFELYAEDIVDITVIDARSFTLHLDKVNCEYQSINDLIILPAHLERPIFEADPANYRNRTLYDSDPTNPGLYYGPYRVTHAETGARMVMEPNATWFGDAPYFDKVVIKVIENTSALGANLLSGEIDYIAGELGMTTDQALSFARRLKRQHPGKFDVSFKPGLIYEHIDINHDNPALADRRVRQAVLYAINRAAISSQLFGGHQPVAHTSINPLDTVYTDDVTRYDYNPARAGELLDAAGWTAGADGLRRNAAGETLTLSLMTTAGDRTRALVQQAIQSDLAKIGIQLTIENEPARVLFGQTTRERKFPHMVMYAWFSAPRNIPRTTLHSDMIPTEANGWAGQNYPGFKNDRMDRILDDLEVVCEPAANQALWDELQQLYAAELPSLPLYFRANAYIIPKWLTGIRPTGHQDLSTLWIEHWKAEKQ